MRPKLWFAVALCAFSASGLACGSPQYTQRPAAHKTASVALPSTTSTSVTATTAPAPRQTPVPQSVSLKGGGKIALGQPVSALPKAAQSIGGSSTYQYPIDGPDGVNLVVFTDGKVVKGIVATPDGDDPYFAELGIKPGMSLADFAKQVPDAKPDPVYAKAFGLDGRILQDAKSVAFFATNSCAPSKTAMFVIALKDPVTIHQIHDQISGPCSGQ